MKFYITFLATDHFDIELIKKEDDFIKHFVFEDEDGYLSIESGGFLNSLKEVDLLVELTQQLDGVYGSRITGGGFGGCTVTLVQRDQANAVIEAIQSKYYEQTGIQCQCFITQPGHGAKVLAIDMDCKPESDFFKK